MTASSVFWVLIGFIITWLMGYIVWVGVCDLLAKLKRRHDHQGGGNGEG